MFPDVARFAYKKGHETPTIGCMKIKFEMFGAIIRLWCRKFLITRWMNLSIGTQPARDLTTSDLVIQLRTGLVECLFKLREDQVTLVKVTQEFKERINAKEL